MYKKFQLIFTYDIIQLDTIISGYYELRASDVIGCMDIDPYYNKLWTQFIESCDQNQLKKLLLLCSNSLSLESKFQINLIPDAKLDINISTCTRQVNLSEKLFENSQTLSTLKLYLDDIDQTIVDAYNYIPSRGLRNVNSITYIPLSFWFSRPPVVIDSFRLQQIQRRVVRYTTIPIRSEPRVIQIGIVREFHIPNFMRDGIRFGFSFEINIGYLFQNNRRDKLMFCLRLSIDQDQKLNLNPLEKFIMDLITPFLQYHSSVGIDTVVLSDITRRFLTN